MPSRDLLRLRVSVQRHGVPDVKLVWPCERSDDLTVSKFLAQISQVIPLEGGEWGLEDYVVELADGLGGTYECLHFQPISQILQSDDQVLIRCLQGEDLKRRRLNGRHQITSDGKHLIDGLVFGRPWLRSPRDRPALELPPRKRVRTALDYDGYGHFDDEDEENEAREPRLLPEGPLLLAGTDEDDESFIESEEEEQDAYGTEDEEADAMAAEDQQEAADELRLLKEDNLNVGDDLPVGDPRSAPLFRSVESASTARLGSLDLGSLDAIVALRAAFPFTPATVIELELLRKHRNLRQTYDALKASNDPVISFDEMMDNSMMGLLDTTEAAPPRAAEDGGILRPGARPLIEVVETSDGTGPEALPKQHASRSIHDAEADGESSSSEATSSSSSSCTSSDSDDSSSYQSSESGGGSDESSEAKSSSSDSSDSEAESSDNDSDSDNGVSLNSQAAAQAQGEGNENEGRGLFRQASQKGRAPKRKTTADAPGRLTRTQKRNARRRRNMAQRQLTNADGEAVGDQAAKANQPAPLEERKAELLRALEVLKPYGDSAEEVREQEVASEPASGGRRLRIELGASRRLLFGSLGLKPPKNKADEEKIKQQLMKDVRPVKNARLTESGESVSGKGADTSEAGLEDWRPYVTYRAVECCRDGVVLSEPPFPFKQRWDPQQRGRKKGKRGRASQDFSLNEHYDEDDDSGLYMDEDPGWARGTKGRKSETPRRAQRSEAWEHEGQSKMATEEAAVDDLPCVPGDVGSLPEAQADGLTEGMVITWKQMTMSKATRWQPQMVQRTGRVLAGSDAANVHVVLATRDREDRRKMYDQKTGERVYDKFEVPDSEGDGEDDGEDDGKRTVSWAELLDPRVLQGPPAPATTAAAGEGGQDEATKAVGERQAEAEGVQA